MSILAFMEGEEIAIESDDYNLERDQFEVALLKAVRQNKPVLASSAEEFSWSMLPSVGLSIKK